METGARFFGCLSKIGAANHGTEINEQEQSFEEALKSYKQEQERKSDQEIKQFFEKFESIIWNKSKNIKEGRKLQGIRETSDMPSTRQKKNFWGSHQKRCLIGMGAYHRNY